MPSRLAFRPALRQSRYYATNSKLPTSASARHSSPPPQLHKSPGATGSKSSATVPSLHPQAVPSAASSSRVSAPSSLTPPLVARSGTGPRLLSATPPKPASVTLPPRADDTTPGPNSRTIKESYKLQPLPIKLALILCLTVGVWGALGLPDLLGLVEPEKIPERKKWRGSAAMGMQGREGIVAEGKSEIIPS